MTPGCGRLGTVTPSGPRRPVRPVRLVALVLILAVGLLAPAAAAERSHPPADVPDRVVLTPYGDTTRGLSVTWRVRTGATTRLELRRVGAEDVRSLAPDVTASVRGTGATHPSVRLTGLEPGVAYDYRVGGEGGWTPWRTFTTAPTTDATQPWSFLYFGDAQNGLADRWPDVVARAHAAHPDASLNLHAGDLINNADDDGEWGDWFAGAASVVGSSLTVTTPGNHEYSGDPLIAAYRAHLDLPTNGPLLRGEDVYYVDHRGVRFVSLNANDPLGGPDQALWLDLVLRTNPHPWTVVTFHQPIFSGSVGRDNPLIRAWWRPVLERHDVDLVLQGHDHVYARGHMGDRQLSAQEHDGPVYVVSVAGSKYYDLSPADRNNWTANGATRVVGAEHTSTYQHVEVTADRLTYRAVVAGVGPRSTAQVGDLLDAFTITRTAAGKRVRDGLPTPVDPVEPEEPVEPVDPVEPVEPVDPVDPVAPAPAAASVVVGGARVDATGRGSVRVRVRAPHRATGRVVVRAGGRIVGRTRLAGATTRRSGASWVRVVRVPVRAVPRRATAVRVRYLGDDRTRPARTTAPLRRI